MIEAKDDRIREFFTGYERGANSFDPEHISREYCEAFIETDPDVVEFRRNDESMRDNIRQSREMFQNIGFRAAEILSVEDTFVDSRHALARVCWRMSFQKDSGETVAHDFVMNYVLRCVDGDTRILLAMSDESEEKALRAKGLVPDASS